MRCIEIGGIDNTGKSTQIKYLAGIIDAYIPPALINYSHLFPKTLEARVKLYSGSNIDTIINATCEGILSRKTDIESQDKEYVLLDRGYITLFASNIARVMNTGKSFDYAKEHVSQIWAAYGVTQDESLSIILTLDKDPVANFIQREGQDTNESHAGYLRHFNESINILSQIYPAARIDANEPKYHITARILNIINEKVTV